MNGDEGFTSLAVFARSEVERLFGAVGVPIPGLLADALSAPEAATDDELVVWDVVGVDDYRVEARSGGVQIEATLTVLPGREPSLDVPGLDGAKVVLATLGSVRLDVTPAPVLVLGGPTVRLRFPASLLEGIAGDGSAAPADIEISGIGELSLDAAGGVTFAALADTGLVVVGLNQPWRIGDTGMTLALERLTFRCAGALSEFELLIDEAVLTLPSEIGGAAPVALRLDRARVDRRGFSGTVSAELQPTWVQSAGAYDGPGSADLGGIPIGIRRAAVTLEENLPVGFALRAEAALPFFDKTRPEVAIALGPDGSLRIEIGAAGGGELTLEKEGVASIRVRSVALDITPARTELALSGSLTPAIGGGDLTSPELRIDVERLVVATDGTVALDAGWIVFTPEIVADFIGFSVALQRVGIGFGDRFWVAFDGSVKLVDGLPTANLIGLRFAFDPALFHDPSALVPEVTLEGLYLDASIAEVVVFRGGGRLLSDATRKGFAGDIMLGLPQLGFALEASLLAGINTAVPAYSFLYFALGVTLPVGIPLGQSGLALFGAEGLVGLNVFPAFVEGPDRSWYYDWYKAPPVAGVTHSSKWTNRYLGFALGAGVTLCTADGFMVGTRALLVLALPGPLVLVEGRAAFLAPRTALGENPPLRALMVLDLREATRSIQLFIEAQYEFVAEVLFAHGVLEVFAELRENPRWHIYLGERAPKERRVQAEVLKKLFLGDAYLEIHQAGVDFGGSVALGLPQKKFGPVVVGLSAAAVFDGALSFGPSQLTATLQLWGELVAKAFGVGLTFAVQALVAARVPTPWWLRLAFSLRIELPWPLPDARVEVERVWEEEVPPAFPAVLTSIDALPRAGQGAISLSPGSTPVGVPLDARLCLTFTHRAVNASGAALGGLEANQSYAHNVGDYTFQYTLAELRFERVDGAETVPLYGMWQALPARIPDATGGTLVLLSKSTFVYGRWLLDPSVPTHVAATVDVAPPAKADGPAGACVTFGEKQAEPATLPPSFEREGVTFAVRQPSVTVEYPRTLGDSPPLRGGLNVFSLVDVPPLDGGKRDGRSDRDPARRRGPAPVVLEIRWPVPVYVERLVASAARIVAMSGALLVPFERRGDRPLDRLYLIGPEVHVAEVCVVTAAAAQAARGARVNARAGQRTLHDLRYGIEWTDEEFILSPHTTYRVSARVDKESTPGNGGARGGTPHDAWTVTFATGGTPTSLAPYLRAAAVGFRYSDADGTLVPVYRGDDLAFFFNVPYIRKMYEVVADEQLDVIVRDARGTLVGARVVEWRKAADRADLEYEALVLAAVNRSLDVPIDVAALPRDDALVCRAPAGLGPAGWLAGGQVHTVQIVRKGSGEVLFETRVLGSLFGSWQEMLGTLNRLAPTLPADTFGAPDVTELESLDVPAALQLVSAPLPATAVTFVVAGISGAHLLVLELPEPLLPDTFVLEWVDAAGSAIALGAPLVRSDGTRWAWRAAAAPALARLRATRRRPRSFQGEPATVEEVAEFPVEPTGAPA
jgi:hypothetical protein